MNAVWGLVLLLLTGPVWASDWEDADVQLAAPHPAKDKPLPIRQRAIKHVQGECFERAGEKFDIDPMLLRAIAMTESSMRKEALNMSHLERTGTFDIGLMQINSSNVAALKRRFGVTERDLRESACTNIMVGAMLLRENVDRVGPTWNAVGRYNAVCTQLKGEACRRARQAYVDQVYKHFVAMGGQS